LNVASGSGELDPIKQFTVSKIGPSINMLGHDFSLTNASLFMIIVVGIVLLIMLKGTSARSLVPGRLQSAAEIFYEFIADTVRSTTGKEGMRFLPLVFSLFMFVLFSNLVGLIPGTFTVTSQIAVTFAFAMIVMLTVVIFGFYKHGLHFLGLFSPSGVPAVLKLIIVPIELISFIARPISLSVRLFANMLAGHIALKVFAGFIVMLLGTGGMVSLLAPLPLVMIVALMALELLVACLQALVFAVLTCIYLNDALHPGH
jgi:F-type H+-transporting ATPase subunit a